MEKTRQQIVDWQKSLPKNISTRELKIQAKAFFGDHVDRINFATVGKIINQFTLETKNIIRRLQYQIAKEQGGSNSHSTAIYAYVCPFFYFSTNKKFYPVQFVGKGL